MFDDHNVNLLYFQDIISKYIIIMAGVLSMVTCTCIPDRACAEPTDLDAQLATARGRNIMLALPSSHNTNRQNTDGCEIKRENMDTDVSCPGNSSSLEHAQASKLKDRSLCPYYYEMETDPTRYPNTLFNARCKCPFCLEDRGLSSVNVCEPEYIPDVVLQRGNCVAGVYQYHRHEIKRQVACLCARKREAEYRADPMESNGGGLVPVV